MNILILTSNQQILQKLMSDSNAVFKLGHDFLTPIEANTLKLLQELLYKRKVMNNE